MWGIIPAAGAGSRIQPLAFSKELLPVGSRFDGETERPRAVSEYLIERMLAGGATRICFVVAPGKSDILEYYGGERRGGHLLRRAAAPGRTLRRDLPRAALHPSGRSGGRRAARHDLVSGDGFAALPEDVLSFLLFPVARPELFDAVLTDEAERVIEIQVKRAGANSRWVWGAFKMPGAVLHELHQLWCERGQVDEYLGTLVNAYLATGGEARGVRAGRAYVDVGTLHGYSEALRVLSAMGRDDARSSAGVEAGPAAGATEGACANPASGAECDRKGRGAEARVVASRDRVEA